MTMQARPATLQEGDVVQIVSHDFAGEQGKIVSCVSAPGWGTTYYFVDLGTRQGVRRILPFRQHELRKAEMS